MVPDEFPSWHAKEHSWQAYGIEVTQPTRDSPIEDGHYNLLAQALRHYWELGVEPVWLPSLTWGDTASGWIQHLETDQGLRDGKSDIGPQLDKQRLLGMVGGDDMALSPAAEKGIEDFFATPYKDMRGRIHVSKAVYLMLVQDWFDSKHLETLLASDKATLKDLAALSQALAALSVGGVDYAKLAKAVNDDAARRLKE